MSLFWEWINDSDRTQNKANEKKKTLPFTAGSVVKPFVWSITPSFKRWLNNRCQPRSALAPDFGTWINQVIYYCCPHGNTCVLFIPGTGYEILSPANVNVNKALKISADTKSSWIEVYQKLIVFSPSNNKGNTPDSNLQNSVNSRRQEKSMAMTTHFKFPLMMKWLAVSNGPQGRLRAQSQTYFLL